MKPHTEKSRSGFECGVNHLAHLRKSTEAVYETTEPFSPITNNDDDNVDICQIIYLEQTLIILK